MNRTASDKVTIKSQVTIRRDMWEKLNDYMDNPTQARKVVYEALRRFWLELKEREEKQLRDSLKKANHLN
jgi:hypothetical protein